jgi:hypothetical protein
VAAVLGKRLGSGKTIREIIRNKNPLSCFVCFVDRNSFSIALVSSVSNLFLSALRFVFAPLRETERRRFGKSIPLI